MVIITLFLPLDVIFSFVSFSDSSLILPSFLYSLKNINITHIKHIVSAIGPAYNAPYKPILLVNKMASGIKSIICLINDTAVDFFTFPSDWITILVVISNAFKKHTIRNIFNVSHANVTYKLLFALPNIPIKNFGNSWNDKLNIIPIKKLIISTFLRVSLTLL